ncbi:MAG TPA: translocation/assembly module TamB domain-containing protein, partial [Candidatus Eisenbacteria bacterium]|nr:translocation/assembly module TamB domain-containing protein [Candidatus Eisenbacteria bacterium]
RADLRDIDPSIFFAASPPVAIGKINGIVELHGTGDHLAGRADVGIREIDWKEGRAHFDSARVVAVLEDRDLRVEPLLVRRGAGEVEIHGRMGLPEPLVPILKKLRNRQYPDSENTHWDLEVTGRGIDLADWKFLVPPGQTVSGGLDIAGRISGTSAQPEIQMDGAARHLNWKGLEVDSLGARAGYRGGSVEIADLVLAQGAQSGTLRGSLPVDLVLLPFSFKIPERPMDLHVEALDGSLHALGFTPWIKNASGSLQTELRLAGTPRHPILDGWARVQNGRVELRERDEVIQNITARFSMKRDVVEVEEAKGILTVGWAGTKLSGGTVSVEPGGTYRLATRQEQSYKLRIRLNQGLVGERGIYAAQVSGNIELTPQRASDGRIYPTARGDLFVHRLEYGGTLKPQDVGEIKPPSLLYEVNIDAPNKILINADRADGELGGELTVRRTPVRQEIVGTLDVIEGKYKFLQKTFRVTQGTLTWEPNSRIPRVNIDAETKEGGAGGGYLITVNLSGYANQVEVKFFAESLEGGSDQRALNDS